jgi:hypothetical protein
MGIVVPAAARDVSQDLVELLLDGIAGPQPERKRPAPTFDAEDAAWSGAAPRHRTGDLPATLHIERARFVGPKEAAESYDARRGTETATVAGGTRLPSVRPPSMAVRIFGAVFAGLLVVAGFAFVLRFSAARSATAPAAAARASSFDGCTGCGGPLVLPVARGTGAPTPTSPSSAAPVPAALARAPAPRASSTVTPTGSGSAGSGRTASGREARGEEGSAPRRARPCPCATSQQSTPAPSEAAARDLGELKTTFQ